MARERQIPKIMRPCALANGGAKMSASLKCRILDHSLET